MNQISLPTERTRMNSAAFYEEPRTGGPRGLRRLVVPLRRALVRVLRPIFHRLAALLAALEADQQQLADRHESLDRRVNALLNQGWDHAALLRRVALLERRLDELTDAARGTGRADGEAA